MVSATVSEHVLDSDHPQGQGRILRKIKNDLHYRTPGGLLLPTAPGIVTQNTAPPDWGGGAYDFNLACLHTKLQCFFRDATDVGNRAMIGVRCAQFPGAWINYKALDVSNNVDVQHNDNVAEWSGLWTNATLRFTNTRRRLKKEIVLSAAGHPFTFGFSVRYPAQLDFIVENNAARLSDDGVVRIDVRKPYAMDANEKHIRCTFEEGSTRNGFRTVWITLNAADMVGAVYPIVIDPTNTAVGTSGVYDTTIRGTASQEDNNYGGAGAIYIRSDRKGLMKIDNSAIPASGNTIDSLTAYAIETALSSGNVTVYRVANANTWVEGTANAAPETGSASWNHCKRSTQSWAGSVGCSTSGTDYDASPSHTWTIPQDFGAPWVYGSVTLTASWAEGWRDTANNGILMVYTSTNMDITSTEGSANTDPYWEIVYTEGGATGQPTSRRTVTVPHMNGQHFSWRR